ncbi:AraC family transcriptional regulator [Mesorhizobium sp. M0977]|uniref:AraC family transcriptional regulator n=1 Tax=unclassified Mesorhizobium TaxID=325217 RepID=UPI003337DCF5
MGISVDPIKNGAIHVIQHGECWLRLAGEKEPIGLGEGDIILVASGVGHTLCDPADAPPALLSAVLSANQSGSEPQSGSGATTLLCAKYSLDGAGPHPMISQFPPLIHLTRSQINASEPLRLATELLRVEARGYLAGHDIVAPRLLDGMLVLLLRAWIEHQPLGTGGWFGALRDKGISRALRLIHERPGDPWTVASLADGAAQCRATFARRFTQLIGEPPLSYVTRWRMDLAAKALQETNQTIHEIGRAV